MQRGLLVFRIMFCLVYCERALLYRHHYSGVGLGHLPFYLSVFFFLFYIHSFCSTRSSFLLPTIVWPHLLLGENFG